MFHFEDSEIFEYYPELELRRFIKYTPSRNHVIMYTYEVNPTKISNRQNLLEYINAMNVELFNTFIEINLAKTSFRYKSSVCHPEGFSLDNDVEKLIRIHQRHFPIVKRCVEGIETTELSPSAYAEYFRKEIIPKNNT
ncbi:hypothetical protein SteCoe_38492 [Stentor coeruleus]|uniref:Uncharacterized protein n=1 Tax=Stentor coeruleus TaxID=5963 RepID=A0A1R2ALF2_9CILI|nr:hypothetical protein SteCoe_38492 [Stentor coeruleus]